MTSLLLVLLLAVPLHAEPDRFPGGMPATPAGEIPSLQHALRFGDWNARIHAVHRLGAAGPAALPSLRAALEDSDWQVRFTAVHELGRLGEPAIGALRQALQEEPCRIVRISAVHWLGSMGDAALSALEEAADDESQTARMSRWYWMRKQGAVAEDSEPPVQTISEDLNVCASVMKPLPPPVREAMELVMGIRKDAPGAHRSTSASGGPGFQDVDLDGPDEDTPERRIALEALAKREKTDRENAINLVLAEGNEEEELPRPAGIVREEEPVTAPAALHDTERRPSGAESGPAPVTGTAEELDRPRGPEPSYFERTEAPAYLKRIRDRRPSFGLTPVAPTGGKGTLPRPEGPGARPDALVRAPVSAMPDHGARPFHDAMPGLLKALREGDERIRARAADEIGRFGSEAGEAVPHLTKALADESPRVRASAALALGKIGNLSEPAVPTLIRCLRDEHVDVRYSAAHALARVSTRRARRAFERYLREEAERSIRSAR